MIILASPGRAASDRELLDYLVTLGENMATKLDQIAADEKTLADTVAKEEADIKAIADIVTPLKAANDALAAANTELTKQVGDLKAGDKLTQDQIDALASASSTVTSAASTAQGHLDALLTAVSGAP